VSHVAGTEPYAWPYDGRLDGPRIALVLAGWDDGWQRRATSGSDGAAATACARLARAVDGFGGAVLTVAHGPGSALLPPVPSAIALTAAGTDGFWGGPLEAELRQRGCTHLFVAGHGLEGPVHSLLRGANDRGFECLLVLDACSTLTEDCREAAGSMVCMSGGIFGAVGATHDVLAALDAAVPSTPNPLAP
jgi:nicotinamidase-related amidase